MSRQFRRSAEKRKPRSVAIDDATWASVKQIARLQGVSVSRLVAESLGNKIRRWKIEKEVA
jgi:hypothetical protein